jgi:2-polyprenyl-3-methyl-5-hydroxy-6-metoxy-1,4-benzoquinol methylase
MSDVCQQGNVSEWDTTSHTVCVMRELLEHVPPWEDCINEAVRVLRPGGLLRFLAHVTLPYTMLIATRRAAK